MISVLRLSSTDDGDHHVFGHGDEAFHTHALQTTEMSVLQLPPVGFLNRSHPWTSCYASAEPMDTFLAPTALCATTKEIHHERPKVTRLVAFSLSFSDML